MLSQRSALFFDYFRVKPPGTTRPRVTTIYTWGLYLIDRHDHFSYINIAKKMSYQNFCNFESRI